MTNYNKWDAKAAALVKEAEEEDEKEKKESDKALGIEEGPKGPPTVKAEKERAELGDHSEKRKEFIDWSKSREVSLTHTPQEEPIDLSVEDVANKALRLSGSEGVSYILPESSEVVKLMLDKCKRVKLILQAKLLTSTVELYMCEDVEIELTNPVGTFQVDECTGGPVRIRFSEQDHVGRIYHQNSPSLSIGWGGGVDGTEFHVVGRKTPAQFTTGLNSAGAKEQLMTEPVVRGEGEYPVNLFSGRDSCPLPAGLERCPLPAGLEPEVEQMPAPEERKRQAEVKRLAGNDMFRASDFLQAALQYTEALHLDPEASACLANRAQCWLKLGDPEKALPDAIKCIEVDPTNAKGWFRKGMSYHAMKKYQEAIPALAEAEKLDPANKQIPEAIKMAQLMARKEASSGGK